MRDAFVCVFDHLSILVVFRSYYRSRCRQLPNRGSLMERSRQPKTAVEMQQMRKKRNLALLAVIAGLALLFYVLTLVKVGGAS